jgi:hypothetical protein
MPAGWDQRVWRLLSLLGLGLLTGCPHPSRQRAAATAVAAPAASTDAAAQDAGSPVDANRALQVYALKPDCTTSPVIAEYRLGSLSMSPLLDTGNAAREIIVPAPLFTALAPAQVKQREVGQLSGKAKLTPYAEIQVPLLGSDRQGWFGVFPEALDTDYDVEYDSLVPLSVIGADSVTLLLSRRQLLLEDFPPGWWDDKAAWRIPFITMNGLIIVDLSCAGQHYPAAIDTGTAQTIFTKHFVRKYGSLFRDTGTSNHFDWHSDYYPPSQIYFLKSGGVTISGAWPEHDLELAGNVDVIPAFDANNQPVGPDVLGLPGFVPYYRPDAPDLAPVAFIGMDQLGRFDFTIDRAEQMLYLWDPAETPRWFPPGGGPAAPGR